MSANTNVVSCSKDLNLFRHPRAYLSNQIYTDLYASLVQKLTIGKTYINKKTNETVKQTTELASFIHETEDNNLKYIGNDTAKSNTNKRAKQYMIPYLNIPIAPRNTHTCHSSYDLNQFAKEPSHSPRICEPNVSYTENSTLPIPALCLKPKRFCPEHLSLLVVGRGSVHLENKKLLYDSNSCNDVPYIQKKETELLQPEYRDTVEDILIKNVTKLPLDQLPVPTIEVDVRFLAEDHAPVLQIINQIAEGNTPPPQLTMKYELLRVCTFRTYPRGNKPFFTRFAKSGFYYAADQDGVVCYCCGIRRYGWNANDDPEEIHKRINIHCKFFRRNEEFNVPAISNGPLPQNVAALDDIPDCNFNEPEGEDVNNDESPERPQIPTRETPKTSGVTVSSPKYPQFAVKERRLESFTGWQNEDFTPIMFAEVGFFFAGLRHWERGDDIDIEHARWSRTCPYIRQRKGQAFIELVQLAGKCASEADEFAQRDNASSATAQQMVLPLLEKHLLSVASQSVLDMGYQPLVIKEALEEILIADNLAQIDATKLLSVILEKEADQPAEAAAAKKEPEETPLVSHDNERNKKERELQQFARIKESNHEQQKDPRIIKAENEKLKEQTMCKICLDKSVCMVFLPCGHLVTCDDCAPSLRKCPICRASIKGTVRTYIS